MMWAVALQCTAAQASERLPRAALVAGSPLPPTAAMLSVLHNKLAAGYHLLEDPAMVRELESLERERTPEQLVHEALREALQRMRRLALEDVLRTLQEAEPHLQQLPPTPSGRALLAAVAARRAHVALVLGETAQATEAMQRALSAEPDLSLDQAQEPPTLVELLERVRSGLREAPPARLRITTDPPGALIVLGGRPLGHAPLLVPVPADTAVVVWAVQDGYHTRNVTVRAAAGEHPLSVEIRLDPLPRTQQLRPLIDALRGASPRTRSDAAKALIPALGVDAVVLVQRGPGERPRLEIFGAPPRFAAGVPDGLELRMPPAPPPPRRRVPPWLFGVAGAVLGAGIATGVFLAVPK